MEAGGQDTAPRVVAALSWGRGAGIPDHDAAPLLAENAEKADAGWAVVCRRMDGGPGEAARNLRDSVIACGVVSALLGEVVGSAVGAGCVERCEAGCGYYLTQCIY